jgi:hypothetical protein
MLVIPAEPVRRASTCRAQRDRSSSHKSAGY